MQKRNFMSEGQKPRRGRYFMHNGTRILGDLFDPGFQSNQSKMSFKYLRTRYYRRVLAAVDEMLQRDDLVFYLSFDLDGGVRAIPEVGPHVVAINIGDEGVQVPVYAQQVAAVFKAQGWRPRHFLTPPGFLEHPSHTSLLTRLHCARALALNLWAQILGKAGTWGAEAERPYYDIPMGYAALMDLPVKPIETRSIDVFFGGSIVHVERPISSLKYWVKPPKQVFREQMFAAMQQLHDRHPMLNVVWGVNKSYSTSHQIELEEEDAYSSRMQDARVCLVPRGATPDTSRFFEALRLGCVIVCDGLPDTWFYRGAPVVQLRDWKELDAVLLPLLKDEQRLQQMHEATVKWWQEKCDEAVVARYIVERVDVPAA